MAAKTFSFFDFVFFLSFLFCFSFYCVRLPEFAVCTDVVLKNVLKRDGRLSARACVCMFVRVVVRVHVSPPPCTAVKKSV